MRSLYLMSLLAAVYPNLALARTAPSPDRVQTVFEQADSNHDGSLSLAEWTAAGRRARGFKMIDADGDGKVTLAELKAAMAKFGRGG